ncbi:hypothetical protein NQL31_003794 [Lotmaria passim]
MHGYRRPRHLVPLPISPSTSLLAPSLSAPLQPRSLKPQSIRQRASHAAARGNARVALSSVLYISSRFIASTTTASSSHETATASSIRSTQDLHTALISLAQAATAASASPTFGAARKAPSSPLERTLFKETATATRDNMASGETPSMGVAQTSQDDTVKSGSSNFPLPLSRQSSSHAGTADTERRLLQRLLLHRRSSRHSQNKSFASATASPSPSVESRLPIHSRSSLSSFPHAIRPDASVHRDAGVVAKLSDGSQASSWARAFELFSEAVQQHHVSPTTQHFNLLLYIAQQHRLWTRVDAVEGFQAQLLASVQQLVEEKKKEVRRRQKEEDDRSGGKAVALGESAQHDASAGSSLTGVSLPASKAAVLSNQIAELREMEAALMPNAQTYELLLNAALARGSWSRALEYCEMRAQSGVAVLTDRAVRQVLQVYALAGEAPVSAGAPSASPTISSPLQRLRTDQQGPGLRAAAQPRSPSTSATTTTSPPPPPHWSVALAFFRSSLHCVTSMQTVWSMVTLLQRAGQSAEVLQVLNDDCRGLLQASLFSLAVHGMRHSHEQEALLQTLRAMSDAAREIGDWRVAQQLLQDVVELRRQQSYTQGSVADKRWGVSSSLPSSALTRDAVGPPLASVLGNEHEVEGTLRDVDRNRNNDTWMEDEEQLSQYVLQSTLHTLRRVRRYPDMIALYRSSPHHHHHHARDAPGADVAGTNAMVVRGRETTVGELTLVWQTMWTAQAIGFIAQAGLATGDLDLLLELCGFVGAGNSLADYAEPLTIAATPRTTADPPADVYDAALRLLQSHILQHRLRHSAALDTAATPVNSHDKAAAESHARRCVTLSQRVYAAYRRRALEAVHAASSPQHQYLARVLEGKATPSVVSRRRQRKQESLRETSPALTQTHAPLVQLLDQSLRSDASAAVFRSLQQQALAHFKRIRRPDTLAIALTMDIIRAPVRLSALATRSSRQGSTLLFTDADAQSVVRAVQDVYDSVLEEEGLGSVQLLHTSTSTSVAHTDSRQPFGSVSVQQLTALSVVTGVAVLLSCEVLACAQPLVLLRLLPLTAHLGWLPRELVPLQLEVAQRAAVEWAAARQCAVTAPIRQQPAPAASTATKTQPSAAHSVAQPSGAAVARFIQLYARSTTTDVSPEPLPPQQQQVLAAAAQLLAELQRTTVGRPPAAAMAAFKHALHDAWPFRKVPRRDDDDDDDVETASIAAVVASINAVVQQVGASTVSRWTMWGDCADLLDGFLASPLASYVHRARETEKRTDAAARREDDSAEEASRRLRQAMPQPNLDTLRVLHTFLRLCDKAEAPFVEYVTIHWLLGNASETAAAEASRPRSKSQAGGQLACSVEKLCEMCEMCSPGASAASRSTTTRPSVLSDLHMETMLLLLDALSWACRRHHRPLARQLHGTLAPWIDKLLSFDGASHQLARLHDAAQSSCMTLLQCFSNGARSDVLRDWSVQLHVLRQLTLSAAQQQQQFRTSSLSTSLNRLRRTAVLVDGLATVVVKLHRTFRFLLTEIALDAHRARTAAAAAAAAAAGGAAAKNTSMEVRNSSPKDKEAQRWHVVPQHCSAVEKAADEFSTCTTDLLLRLVCPCLEVSAEAEMAQQSDALSQQQLARVVAASLVASAHKITDAVWEVDYVAFVWHADFRNPTTTQQGKADADRETSARALIGLRQRGFQLLMSQLRWSDTASALSRPVRLWLLFTAHATLTTARTTKAAVAELCRDLTSLEMLYSLNRPSLRSLSNATAAAAVEQRLVPEPFLHFFIQQVDELTTAMLSRAVLASSAPAHAAGPASALPHMPDGSSPMDRFTKPLVHFSPAVLRPLQQAAQQALYLSLCEGTTDVQPACTARQVTDGRAGAAAAAFSSSAEPCLLPPALLRRCLAWPGQPSQYPILLHTVEVAAYETLREPATVVDVFQAMTQLHSAESTLARPRDSGSDNRNNDNDGQRTSAEMFLTFYLQSASLRRAAPVSEQVCLAALLACAAATAAAASSLDCAPGVRVYAAPPQDLVTLLSAFPQVLSIALFQQWQQHKLTRLQEAVLRSWTLVLLWGGTQASAPDGATEPYRTQSPAPFPLPLRRAALQWLVLTQGTVRPPLAASRHVSSASGGSSAQLVALLNTASESFAKLVTDSLPNDCALQAANERLVSVLSVVPHHSSSSTSSSMSNGEANVSAAVSYCCTRHAVQQLLLHYPAAGHCANSNRATPHVEETQRRNWEVPRTAVRPCAAEMEALVRVLPAPAQEEARERFINGAPDVFDPFASSATQSSTSSCCGREETGRRLDEWAVALLRWVDRFAAEDKRSCTKSAHSSVPPPPSLTIVSSEEAALTWEGLHTHVRAAACELLERPPTLSPVHTTRLKDGEKDFLVSAQLRLSSLRPFIEHFARQGTTLRTSGQTSAAAEVSALVNALLLFCGVYVPLASSTSASPQEAIALLRRELLMLVCAIAPPSSAHGPFSKGSVELYEWFVQQHLRHLLSLNTPTQASPPLPVAAAAVEAFAIGTLLLHHISVAACTLCGCSTTSSAKAFDTVYKVAHELLQQSGQDLCVLCSVLHVGRGDATTLLVCCAVRVWMQASVLLGDAHAVLAAAQRMAADLLRRQRMKAAALWADKVASVESSSSSSKSCLESDARAAAEWLSVVPVAASVVHAMALQSRAAKAAEDESLASLLTVLPFLRRDDDEDHAPASCDGYASLIQFWREQMQQSAAQRQEHSGFGSGSPSLTPALQHRGYLLRLMAVQPFSVVFQLPRLAPREAADARQRSGKTTKMAERLRRNVTDYLAGSPAAYPPLSPPRFRPCLASAQGAASIVFASEEASVETSLTTERLRAAMQRVREATSEEMTAFMQLESTKRGVRKGAQQQRGEAVRHAWHLIERVALQHRQRLSSNHVELDTPPLTPWHEWTSYFLCRNVVAVPHTIHFLRPAVSEVLMLESCRDWAEAMAVVQHSLSSLKRTGATPVQQYMVQLLLQRVRTTSDALSPRDHDPQAPSASDFCARLGSFTYTPSPTDASAASGEEGEALRFSQGLWNQHVGGHAARGAAALTCRLIDILLGSYHGHRAPPASSSATSAFLAQHTLMEALRCSVHDLVVTRGLFLLFWAQRYQRVEGAHAFLSALRAAKIAGDEAFAVQAVLTYLWVTTSDSASQRTELWRTQVLPLLSGQKEIGSRAVDVVAIEKAVQATTHSTYQLSVEAHRAVWKSWAVLCRMGVISEAAALGIVNSFKALNRLSEVDELMVTTCYAIRK